MPLKSVLRKLNVWVDRELSLSGDDAESLSFKKRFWLAIFPSPFAMAFFGSFFWLLGAHSFAIGMWLFGGVVLSVLLVFTLWPKQTERYVLFNQYFFLIFSFVAVLYFGGILHSGGIVFVGLAGALGSLSFLKPRQYRPLFYLFFLSVIVEGALQPFLTPRPDITPTVNLLSFVLHILVIGMVMYRILSYYIEQSIEAKQAEADSLRELDNLKTQFYTNISHEFRTPLTVILGMADEIAEKPKAYLQLGLQLIRQNGNRLLYLVSQMLDLSKLEAGAMTLHFVQSDILTHLRYLAEPFEHLAGERNIQLHVRSALDEIIMDFDPEKMQSLMGNLLSNAIKYSSEGSDIFLKTGTVREIPVPCQEAFSLFPERGKQSVGKYFFLKITDTGQGIPEGQIARIFDRFYQADEEGVNHCGGSGIGLALVKELVELMDGELFVESKMGHGTTFSIYLPISKEATVRDVPFSESAHEHLPYIKEIKGKWMPHRGLPQLLVVEDNTDVVQYIRSVLENEYQVDVANNGAEGLEKALTRIPDLIVSDVMMPEMGGFELCGKLKNDFRTSHIPVVLLTAKADLPSKLVGLETGADAYLTKPFHKEELLMRLRKLIEMRKKLQLRYGSGEMPQPTDDRVLQQEDVFIKKVRDVVEKNLGDEGFGVPHLCQQLAMSRAQLYRKFEALTDLPVGKFIRTKRLRKAKELLQNNGLNVTEAAFETGFRSLSHFSSAFKEEFGVSPSDIS
ncbi:MAG: response regulator [Saprospiraceae bacterium]|nr:response regulator [Saprospiraceae bacterium]